MINTIFHVWWMVFLSVLTCTWCTRNIPPAPSIQTPVIMHTEGKKQTCRENSKVDFFMYHYIRDWDTHDTLGTKSLSVPPKLFREHMKKIRTLADSGVITLIDGPDFLEAVRKKCFPGKNIWVFTADDGWSDMADSLVPIASEYRIPFFLGIITDRIGKPWFVTEDHVRSMAHTPLMTLSSHSVSHTDNSKLSEKDETHEMCDSKKILEKISWLPVETYIYPSGRINPDIDEKVAASCGYTLGWSTSFGKDFWSSWSNLYDLNRIRIQSDTDPHFFDLFLEKEWSPHSDPKISTWSRSS